MATNNTINSGVPLNVAFGGTGKATLTSHATLTGEGTAPIVSNAVGVSGGYTLIGSSSGAAAMEALSSNTNSVTATGGVNTLNLDVEDWVTTTSWTPALKFGGASVGLTYTAHSGTYRRVGLNVFVTGTMTINAVGTSTGTATITGLPLSAEGISMFNLSFSKLTFTGQVMVHTSAVSTTITLGLNSGSGAIGNLTNTAFTSGTVLTISGMYMQS